MEDNNPKVLEALLEKASGYGKTVYELLKLKILDKTSDVASTLITHVVVLVIIAFFLLFFAVGSALWIGEILGKNYLGFLAVAAFYGFVALFIHFFLHKWIKRMISNYIIKQEAK
jgi:hypothetical protein